MALEAGEILEGQVSGITNYGAFISLPGGKSGLVHISEISYSFVSDIHDVLSEGQAVKVKVLSIDDSGRINLSIKKALPPPPRPQNKPQQGSRPQQQGARPQQSSRPRPSPAPNTWQGTAPKQEISFEDRLKQFMQESDSKLSSSALYKKNPQSRRGSRR